MHCRFFLRIDFVSIEAAGKNVTKNAGKKTVTKWSVKKMLPNTGEGKCYQNPGK